MVIFPDVHPRWSFVKCDADGNVIEAAEKRPISNLATEGFYYFGSGAAFVEAAEAMILKDASVNGCSTSAPSTTNSSCATAGRRASHRQSQLRFARYSAGRAGLREPPRGTRPIVRTMKTARLEAMTKGWFVGDFSPTLHRTRDIEVAVKHYRAGDHEPAHYHKIAREFTAVISGRVRMSDREFGPGDIIEIEPGETTDFRALTRGDDVVKFRRPTDNIRMNHAEIVCLWRRIALESAGIAVPSR